MPTFRAVQVREKTHPLYKQFVIKDGRGGLAVLEGHALHLDNREDAQAFANLLTRASQRTAAAATKGKR